MKKHVEVLVTGGNHRAGLAVARSLAEHGVSFLIVGEERHSFSFHSRYVKNALVSPSPIERPEEFFQFILSTVRKHNIQLIIPVGEEPLIIFNQHREEIEKHARLAMASSPSLKKVLDKRINLEIARQLGIPCPKQFELKGLNQIPEMIETLGLPIVLKPPGSRHHPELPSFPFKVIYAHDESQLRRYIDEYCRDQEFPIFQECATGVIHNLCCFAARGETVAIHEYHSLRRMRGNGVLRRVVELLPEAEQAARNILRALEWDGVAHVAFFVNHLSNKLYYMETNGRLWSSVEGSIHAGWDFPYWIYRYFLHGCKPVTIPIRLGSRTCWHRGDLMALMIYLLGGEIPATGTNPGRIRAVFQYLSGFNPMIHSDVFRLRDPVPAVIDHWNLVKEAFQMLRELKTVDQANLFSSPTKKK